MERGPDGQRQMHENSHEGKLWNRGQQKNRNCQGKVDGAAGQPQVKGEKRKGHPETVVTPVVRQ